MTSDTNAPSPSAPGASPHGGAPYSAARARLAWRRSLPFARVWGASIGTMFVLALIVPLTSEGTRTPDRAARVRLAADTLRSAQRLREAEGERAVAESLLVAARNRTAVRAPVPARPPRPVAAAAPTPLAPIGNSEPTVAAFAERIAAARRLRTAVSWLAVAEHPAVAAGPRMRALADTLRSLEARLAALENGPTREQELSALQQRMGRTGYTILAIAENRRAELEASGVTAVPPVAVSVGLVATVLPVPPAPDTQVLAEPTPDTAALAARVTSAVAALLTAQIAHDSVGAALRTLLAVQPTAPTRGRLAAASPAIAFGLLLLAGLVGRFGVALRHELRWPTLADASEAARLVGGPVLAVVRDPMLDGPARFRPSGVDPFRLLYLGLTATGTRARAAIVTGSDADIAAATGARLAIAAAADHRNTLVADLDAAQIGLSRTFRERAEPGSNDVLARSFDWRDVARPVGSSDGLPIMMIPAGTERDDLVTGEAMAEVRDHFARFRAGFELAIMVAPVGRVALAASLLDGAPVILTAVVGETPLDAISREADEIRASGRRLHGLVLWDAPRPELPSRAELAALLSKRKGRTPGGSFEAVQRVLGKDNSGRTKPQ